MWSLAVQNAVVGISPSSFPQPPICESAGEGEDDQTRRQQERMVQHGFRVRAHLFRDRARIAVGHEVNLFAFQWFDCIHNGFRRTDNLARAGHFVGIGVLQSCEFPRGGTIPDEPSECSRMPVLSAMRVW